MLPNFLLKIIFYITMDLVNLFIYLAHKLMDYQYTLIQSYRDK